VGGAGRHGLAVELVANTEVVGLLGLVCTLGVQAQGEEGHFLAVCPGLDCADGIGGGVLGLELEHVEDHAGQGVAGDDAGSGNNLEGSMVLCNFKATEQRIGVRLVDQGGGGSGQMVEDGGYLLASDFLFVAEGGNAPTLDGEARIFGEAGTCVREGTFLDRADGDESLFGKRLVLVEEGLLIGWQVGWSGDQGGTVGAYDCSGEHLDTS